MPFYELKTNTYATDVFVTDHQFLTIELDPIQASKYGDAKNVENITKLLVTDLGQDPAILEKMTITANVNADTLTIEYADIRYKWERLAVLQHIRLLKNELSDDVVITKFAADAHYNAVDKLVLSSTPIVTSGNTIFQLFFDVISGYPNEAGGGLVIYEKMFKEWMAFLTDGGIDIQAFGSGAEAAHITATFDNLVTPTQWIVTFDMTAPSDEKIQDMYTMASIAMGGIPNTYHSIYDAGLSL